MNRTASQTSAIGLRIAQVALWLNGIAYIITALLLLFAPAWFFQYIGNFPPYNRHYEGDVGSFILPIGIGLIIAARNPTRHRLFIAVVALGSTIHIINHIFDDVSISQSLFHLIADLGPLILFVVLLLLGLRPFADVTDYPTSNLEGEGKTS